MSEIDWDLAPEGAVAIKQDCGHWKNVTWVNDKGEWWDNNDALWCVDVTNNWVQTIAVRPVTQQKTVADAYEWANGEWHGYGRNAIAYNPNSDFFSYFVAGDVNSKWCVICTREQFEDYAKEQESKQEGEKWTHEVYGDKCRIKESEPDRDGCIIVVTESGGYHLCTPDELKPIKPTLTKEKRDFLCSFSKEVDNKAVTIEVVEYLSKHDII